MKTLKILLTGVTGNIGSHVLYEIMEHAATFNIQYKVYVLVRPKEGASGADRLATEVLNKALMPLKIQTSYENFLENNIEIIETDLQNFQPTEDMQDLIVYHLAASVNLANTSKAQEEIFNVNYLGTKNLIEQLKGRIKKFVFVSTAFSTGDVAGLITDDYHSRSEQDFRNPYERFKLQLEKEILALAKEQDFECTIARPSVVGGRLVDFPRFVMSRYIVFYMIGFFFMKMKEEFDDFGKVRIVANKTGGLNIVPVDYVAQGIFRAANIQAEQLNITATKNVPNSLWIPHILERCGVTDYELVDEEPQDKSPVEVVYYKTVGRQISRYLNSKDHRFESKLIRRIMGDVEEPKVAEDFIGLYDFAHDHNFDNANVASTIAV